MKVKKIADHRECSIGHLFKEALEIIEKDQKEYSRGWKDGREFERELIEEE